MCMCVYRPGIKHLSLLLQLLKPPCQIVKVDVVRGVGVAAEGGRGQRVGNGGEFWESVAVERLRGSVSCREK